MSAAGADADTCPRCGGVVLHGRFGLKVCGDDECDFFFDPPILEALAGAEVQQVSGADAHVLKASDLKGRLYFIFDDGKSIFQCPQDDAPVFLRALADQLERKRRQ